MCIHHTNTPQPAPVPPEDGYDDGIFLSPPPKDLQCPACELTLREPHKFVCCGTIVCNVCSYNVHIQQFIIILM